jgi:M3 family oligoendopeptidase
MEKAMSFFDNAFNWIDFGDLDYKRPDTDKLSDAFRRCRLRIKLAMSAHACVHALNELQSTLINFMSMSAVARINHDLDLNEKFWTDECDFYDQVEVQIKAWQQAAYKSIASSRFRDEIEAEIGTAFFREAEMLGLTIQDRVIADLNEEIRLERACSAKLSQIRIVVDNREYTIEQIKPLLSDRDDLIRKHACTAFNNAFYEEQSWFDTCLSQLVSVRHRMSLKLGFKSFAELGNQRMGRHDYNLNDIVRFRENVIKYFVPVCREIRRLQAVRLGKTELLFRDLACLLPEGGPRPELPCRNWIEVLGRVLADLLAEGNFLADLAAHDYIDIEDRAEKSAGSYCRMIYNVRLPFIQAGCAGSQEDLVALINVSGRACAELSSLSSLKVLEDHASDFDICQILGKALEYLCLPELAEFFGSQTELAAMLHMTQSILEVPELCLADHFQQEIYEHPEMSSEQRHECWRRLERLYLPDIEYGEEKYFANGGRWQSIEQIFTAPFNFIDQAIAVLASLDLWQTSRKDQAKAVRRYKRLCGSGSSGTYRNQLVEAGIASPFDEGTFKRLTYAVCDYLSL